MFRSSAAAAVSPSGHTVTSCPMRGSSSRITSWSDFSSSANSSLSPFRGGVLIFDLLRSLGEWESDAEGGPAAGPARLGVNLAAGLGDDPVRDGKPQPGPLPRSPSGEERFKDVFEHLGRHAAAVG